MGKRVVLTNPDEPRAGDYAFQLYDNAHPINGDPETIARMKAALRGLRGEEVTMVFKGHRVDSDTGETKRFRVTRNFTLNSYSDVFGPGSAYASAAHYVRDKYSSDELLMDSIEIEEYDGGDDSEYGG
jgi:hypothetical protein